MATVVEPRRAAGVAVALLPFWSHAGFALDHAALAREAMSRCSSFLAFQDIVKSKGMNADIIGFDRGDENGNIGLSEVIPLNTKKIKLKIRIK